MSNTNSTPTRKEILYAFAVEEVPDQALLQDYQQRYPQFADDLLTLYHELTTEDTLEEWAESPADAALIEAAWERHAAALPSADPFASFTIPQLRNVAKALELPMQVITAFQERRVLIATVPRRFMRLLAEAMNTTREYLTAALATPGMEAARSYKADTRPTDEGAVSFAQILEDAELPADRIAELLAEGD